MLPNADPRKYAGFDSEFFGLIRTPASGRSVVPDGVLWCADNGAFTGIVSSRKFLPWLEFMRPWRARCLFAAAPDVVANVIATLDRFRWWSWKIRSLGFPVALVAQDGLESVDWPPSWAYDALFVGGSTAWKMSDAAAHCIWQAQNGGKWVHVGRVNSQKRIRHFALLGVNSVDGTGPRFAPDRYFRILGKQLQQPPLFRLGGL